MQRLQNAAFWALFRRPHKLMHGAQTFPCSSQLLASYRMLLLLLVYVTAFPCRIFHSLLYAEVTFIDST